MSVFQADQCRECGGELLIVEAVTQPELVPGWVAKCRDCGTLHHLTDDEIAALQEPAEEGSPN